MDGLHFEIVKDVLDFLGVPADETQRKRFRHFLSMAGTIDPVPAKIEERLRRIESEVGQMLNPHERILQHLQSPPAGALHFPFRKPQNRTEPHRYRALVPKSVSNLPYSIPPLQVVDTPLPAAFRRLTSPYETGPRAPSGSTRANSSKWGKWVIRGNRVSAGGAVPVRKDLG
jgi:hypothetical protein